MGLRPETRYAKSGDVHIAYQISGARPRDLVLASGFVSHLGLDWDRPAAAHVFERLGKFARLIRFDKRGTGMSDRVQVATLEERMDDVRAVMDAAQSERAVLAGWSEGGPMSLLFAANDPEERRKFVTLRRMSASPGAALAIARMNTEIDVRHVLPVIRVPTLILHRAKDRDVTVENGRYLA